MHHIKRKNNRKKLRVKNNNERCSTHCSCKMKSVFSGDICPVTGCLNAVLLWLWLDTRRKRETREERGERNNNKREKNKLSNPSSITACLISALGARCSWRSCILHQVSRVWTTFPVECRMCNGADALAKPLMLFHTNCGTQHKTQNHGY